MILERENAATISDPSADRVERELRQLRTTGPSTFATLTSESGDYLQTAGSRAGLFVERRDAKSGRHFRAHQPTAVVPFADDTEISFSSGRVKLRATEWFQMRQVTELFVAYLRGKPLPSYVLWRDITDIVSTPGADE